MVAQVAGIALDRDHGVGRRALGVEPAPVAIDQARIDRQIRELALEHAAGILGDETYLARLKELRSQRDPSGRAAGPRPSERSSGSGALGESRAQTSRRRQT